MRTLSRILVLAILACCSLGSSIGNAGDPSTNDPLSQSPPVLLQMIRDDAIHRDLDLSPSQVGQVMRVLEVLDGPWFRARNLPIEQQQEKIGELTVRLENELSGILTPQQRSRVNQLVRQALGTRMVLREDVIAKLGLSPSTVLAFREAFQETDRRVAEIQKKVAAGELEARSASGEVNQLKAKERQTLVKMLNDDQKTSIGSLTGEAFDFSQVQRTYPLAPELSGEGATWIQGGPLTLEDLRGKVVAVHFYAFQCINCQRNFPHYQAWHESYADKGLVIIGIQTPETATERNLERVAAAVKSDGMEYPVLMDAQSSNWKSWSNTMWPTVYLIDKRGFIRRWWQGELNWQGTPGEQQMRESIERLLAEDT